MNSLPARYDALCQRLSWVELVLLAADLATISLTLIPADARMMALTESGMGR